MTWGKTYIKTWDDADKYYHDHPRRHWGTGTMVQEVQLYNNTWLQRYVRSDGLVEYSIRYHFSQVVTYYPGGGIYTNPHDWYTKTTLERINDHTPNWFRVTRRKFVWYTPDGSKYMPGYINASLND